jgi:hypothetical protein
MNISTQKVRQLRQEIRGRTIQFRTQNPVHSLSQITQESDFDNASSTIVIGTQNASASLRSCMPWEKPDDLRQSVLSTYASSIKIDPPADAQLP